MESEAAPQPPSETPEGAPLPSSTALERVPLPPDAALELAPRTEGAPAIDPLLPPAQLFPSAFPAPSFMAAAPAALPAPVPAAPRQPASAGFLVAVTVVSLVADLATKGWAKSHLSNLDGNKSHGLHKMEIVKGHLDFIFAQNPGGAWSFLRGLPDSLRRPFFLVVSAAAIVFIVSIYQRVHRDQTSMKWGLPLALGGAMGNLVDRIRYGWVVDFIDVSLRWGGHDHHWPTFNVADIAIVIGVGLMAIDMLRSRGLHHQDEPGPVPEPIR